MNAIMLREDLHRDLDVQATKEGRSLTDLINDAVTDYLLDVQRRKIKREQSAFEGIHDTLKRTLFGQWVAINEGALVDHDVDRVALFRRIRSRYGNETVLITPVEEQAVREFYFRTPNIGKLRS